MMTTKYSTGRNKNPKGWKVSKSLGKENESQPACTSLPTRLILTKNFSS